MTLQELQNLKTSGRFHHATYRNHGTLWEGLWIYECFNGTFKPAGAFFKDNSEIDAAYNLVRSSGVSVGSYGNG